MKQKFNKPTKAKAKSTKSPFFIKESEIDNTTWYEEIKDEDSQIATIDETQPIEEVEELEFDSYAPVEAKDQKYYDKVDLAALRVKGHEMAKVKAAYVVYLSHGETLPFDEFANLFLSGCRI